MGHYDIMTDSVTPVNFFAGDYPIRKEALTVDAGASVSERMPVKLVDGKIQPVAYIGPSAAQDYAAATAAVHTLVIAESYSADDTITVNGTVYTCVASSAVAASKQFNAGAASAVAGSIKEAIALVETGFTVANSGANVTFTQRVAGTGALPTVETSVTSGCSISTTTEYAAGTDPLPAKSAAENTAEGLYGIAAEAAAENKPVVVYLTGEFFAEAMTWPENVTADMLKPYFREIDIFLK